MEKKLFIKKTALSSILFLHLTYIIYDFNYINIKYQIASFILNCIFVFVFQKNNYSLDNLSKYNMLLVYGVCILNLCILVWQNKFIDEYYYGFFMFSLLPLFCIILYYVLKEKNTKNLKYLFTILFVPLCIYILFNMKILFETSAILLLIPFIFEYSLVLFMIKKLKNISKNNFGFKKALLYLLAFSPIIGLLVNSENSNIGSFSGGLFGDFSHWFFYIVAFFNGMVLVLTSDKISNKYLRLLSFYLKSVGIAYIAYFCIAMLPALPVGIMLSIIVIGLLALVPYILFYIQGEMIVTDFKILKNSFSATILLFVFLLGILTIPSYLFANARLDKQNLKNSIIYYEGDKSVDADINRLQHTLGFLTYKNHSSRSWFFGSGSYNIPVYSNLYVDYILKDMNLKDDYLYLLEDFYINTSNNPWEKDMLIDAQSKDVTIESLKVDTKYDEKNDIYKSYIHMELINNSDDNMVEFSSRFYLPQNVFVDDYYLDIFGERKKGLLTPREAAVKVYNSIISRNQDPGIITYMNPNEIMLKVFPFSKKELRKTGFELVHKNSFDLTIGDKTVHVAGSVTKDEVIANGGTLLSSSKIKSLPKLERTPNYYFILDASKKSSIKNLVGKIEKYTTLNDISKANILVTSYKIDTISLENIINIKTKASGKFDLELAINEILSKENSHNYPVIFVVSQEKLENYNNKKIFALSTKYPEMQYYYEINKDLKLKPHSFYDDKDREEIDKPIYTDTRVYESIPVANDNQTKLIKNNYTDIDSKDNVYLKGIEVISQNIELYQKDESGSIEAIKNSMRNNILTYDTAFITLETKEQEYELLRIQEQILNGEYKTSSPVKNLSEPSIVWIIFMIFVVCIFNRKKINVFDK